MPEPETGRAARLVSLGLRLRADAVAHFLAEARAGLDRHALSALGYHASELRGYAAGAPERFRTYSAGGFPDG